MSYLLINNNNNNNCHSDVFDYSNNIVFAPIPATLLYNCDNNSLILNPIHQIGDSSSMLMSMESSAEHTENNPITHQLYEQPQTQLQQIQPPEQYICPQSQSIPIIFLSNSTVLPAQPIVLSENPKNQVQSFDLYQYLSEIPTLDISPNKLFNCSCCAKVFRQRHSLRDHVRSKHTNEKPFLCLYCGRKFSVKYNLTVHQRIHTGIRPYICSHCGRKFTQKGTLNTHVKSIH